jgi:hypothetical protein
MINYKAFDVAVVGETIGWKSAAGYLEGEITRIDTRKNTACKKTMSDWVLVELDPYLVDTALMPSMLRRDDHSVMLSCQKESLIG